MPARCLFAAVVLLAAAGCARQAVPDARLADPSPERAAALLDVWAGFDDASAGLAQRETEVCGPAFATWFADFGVRGLACVAAQIVTPTDLIERTLIEPFLSGPHTATAQQVRLDLDATRAFGHYDPAFVEWLVENGIPDGDNATIRAFTKSVYDRRFRRIARIYWLTYTDLDADGFPASTPDGPLADYAAFLDGGPAQASESYGSDDGFSVFAFADRSETLLPQIGVNLDNEWTAKYEANTAYGFWLRRRADGTLSLWHDGLRHLLQTYDAAWLSS